MEDLGDRVTDAEKWFYRLDHSVTWESGHPFPEDMASNDASGIRRLEMKKEGAVTVLAGYAKREAGKSEIHRTKHSRL